MIHRERLATIVGLALPIIGGMVSQNVLNLVDTLMVGSLGDVALAAVGIASFVQFFCTAFITGIAAGVQATAARRVGQGRGNEAAAPLNGGLLIALCVGVPLSLLLITAVPHFFPVLANDAEVAAEGTPYLQVRLAAMTALAMNFSFRGFWNGISLSKIYFRTIVVVHALNVVLNYLLIFGKFGFPEMGTTGAGLASAIAFYVGTLLYFVQAFRLTRHQGFLKKMPTRDEVVAMLRLSAPTGIQQTFFAGGMTLFFAMLSRVGTREVAASNVLVNLLLVVILPSIGFGLASATLVGQALGRKDVEDARRWGAEVMGVALVIMCLLGLFGALAPRLLLMPFLHDPVTLALAESPLRLIAILLPIDAMGLVLLQSLIGAGHTQRVMWITIGLQWGLQLPLVYVVAFWLDGGLMAIWGAYFLARVIQTAVLAWEWRGHGWTDIRV